MALYLDYSPLQNNHSWMKWRFHSWGRPVRNPIKTFAFVDRIVWSTVGTRCSFRCAPIAVVGPAEYDVAGVKYLTPDDQEALPYRLTDLLPWNHFGRKNVGYMYAIHHGAKVRSMTRGAASAREVVLPISRCCMGQPVTPQSQVP